jgi:hypothetical protein
MQCSVVNNLCTAGCAPWGTINIYSSDLYWVFIYFYSYFYQITTYLILSSEDLK